MAIISQTISPLTAIVLISEVDRTNPASVQAFQNAWENFNLQLKNTTVEQLNTFATQANAVRDEVNSFKTQTETLKNTATTQANKATTEATKASLAAVSATQMRNETAGLIELLPSDASLAYTKAAIDAKLNDRDLANFLDFKF
jgi:hypothetical protein